MCVDTVCIVCAHRSLRGSVRSTLDALVRSGKVSFSGGMYRM